MPNLRRSKASSFSSSATPLEIRVSKRSSTRGNLQPGSVCVKCSGSAEKLLYSTSATSHSTQINRRTGLTGAGSSLYGVPVSNRYSRLGPEFISQGTIPSALNVVGASAPCSLYDMVALEQTTGEGVINPRAVGRTPSALNAVGACAPCSLNDMVALGHTTGEGVINPRAADTTPSTLNVEGACASCSLNEIVAPDHTADERVINSRTDGLPNGMI